jgi:signal transduction histidine kinase
LFPDAVGREDEWYVDRLADRTENFTLTKELKTSAGLWLRMTDTRTPDGGWVGLRTDITELRQALDDLEAAQGSLMQKERLAALGQLAATVSHELRNPLGAMQTSTYFLRHQLPDAGEKEVQALERIERNIHRCDRIIDELLDFTRQRDLDTRQTEFNSWLREVLAELNLPAEVTIIEDFAAENPVIPLDGEYFRRVIVNLFDNACQAMTSMDGSASLTERNLTISTSVAAEGLVLTFRDTGVGMSPDVRNRIFEPMFSTKGFGVGLGLAMAEQIIKRHRATIRVSSEPGAGTEITVILPLSEG